MAEMSVKFRAGGRGGGGEGMIAKRLVPTKWVPTISNDLPVSRVNIGIEVGVIEF